MSLSLFVTSDSDLIRIIKYHSFNTVGTISPPKRHHLQKVTMSISPPKNKSGWWQLKSFLMFIPIWGKIFHPISLSTFFSKGCGEKPPTVEIICNPEVFPKVLGLWIYITRLSSFQLSNRHRHLKESLKTLAPTGDLIVALMRLDPLWVGCLDLHVRWRFDRKGGLW